MFYYWTKLSLAIVDGCLVVREMTLIISDSNLITYTLSDVENLDQNLFCLRFTQATMYTLMNDNLVLFRFVTQHDLG